MPEDSFHRMGLRGDVFTSLFPLSIEIIEENLTLLLIKEANA